MAKRAAPASTPRDDLRVVALRAALVAVAAASCVVAWGQVHAFFGGGIGLAGHLFPKPPADFWWVATLFAVGVTASTSVIERAAVRRRLVGRRAVLAALGAGALAWPAFVVATTQAIYLGHALGGDPTKGYAQALASASYELGLPARLHLGDAVTLATPVILVTLARLHRLPLAPTFAGVSATSALAAALALGVLTRQSLRAWLVESPVLWLAVGAGAVLPLAFAAIDRVPRRAASQAALPPSPGG